MYYAKERLHQFKAEYRFTGAYADSSIAFQSSVRSLWQEASLSVIPYLPAIPYVKFVCSSALPHYCNSCIQ